MREKEYRKQLFNNLKIFILEMAIVLFTLLLTLNIYAQPSNLNFVDNRGQKQGAGILLRWRA